LCAALTGPADQTVFSASRAGYGKNLLTNPGFEQGVAPWQAWREGFRREEGEAARSGGACVRLASADAELQYGAFQRLELNQDEPGAVIVEAWSKAQDVSGSADTGYSLYIDVEYADGTHLWAQATPFPIGTHDWVRREVVIAPAKPVRSLLAYLLLRRHTGTVWFDDVGAYVPARGAFFDMSLVRKAGGEVAPQGDAVAATIRTEAGFALGFDAEGRVLSCGAVPGATGAVAAAWHSGFFLRDVAAQSDFVRPAVVELLEEDGAVSVRAASATLDLTLAAELTPEGDGRIAVNGRVEAGTDRDRAVSVYFALPFGSADAVWWADASTSQRLKPGLEYGNWAKIDVGANGLVSRYPWCAVSGPDRGLSICVPPDRPQVMRMGWSSEALYIVFDVGLTAATVKRPRRAEFAFSVFPHDPAWGFRDAARRVYAAFPECFAKRVQSEGIWLITRRIGAIRDAADFHFKFHETGWKADPAGPALGIQSFRYIEPWRWRQRYKGKGAAAERTKEGSLALLEERLKSENDNIRRNSWAVKTSVCHDENGAPVLYIEDAPWGTSALFVCNADPAVPRAGPDNVNQADCYYSAEIASSRYGSGAVPEQDGEYVDSVEGFHWPRVQNYRREHFACSDYPLTFGTQSRRVCMLTAFGHWAFLKHLGDDLHRRGKLMFGNALASHSAYFFTPYFDVLGTEHHWISRQDGSWRPEPEARSNYRRALACRRPYLMLLNTDFSKMSRALVEKYFRRCAFFGFFPSMFSHDAFHDRYFDDPKYYDRDRDLFKKYIPIILDLAKAGWRPVTGARCAKQAIRLERFGQGSDVWLTLLNTDKEREQEAVIRLAPEALGVAASPARVTELFSGRELETGKAPALRLGPDDAAVLRLRFGDGGG